MKRVLNWLREEGNIVIFNTVSAFIISLVALIVSITNAVFVGRQTKINEVLYDLQMEQAQPYFVICTSLEMDSTDGIFGTEHLEVFNRGYANVSSRVTETVIFELNRVQLNGIDTARFKIDDYFYAAFNSDSEDGGLVYHTFEQGNNRCFYSMYLEALQDRNEGASYFLTKTILVRIDYSDLLGNYHTKYYIDREEVQEQKYKKKLSSVQYDILYLRDLDYGKMKEMFSDLNFFDDID